MSNLFNKVSSSQGYHPYVKKIVTYNEDGLMNTVIVDDYDVSSIHKKCNIIEADDVTEKIDDTYILSNRFVVCKYDKLEKLARHPSIDKIYLTTSVLPSYLSSFRVLINEKYSSYRLYVLQKDRDNGEYQYLNVMNEILDFGNHRETRNGTTLSAFGKQIRFDLNRGFPLLTTKRMFFRGIVEELLFFIHGKTDSKYLEQKEVRIWSKNTSREFLDSMGLSRQETGLIGPMYGYQWRFYDAPYNDQLGVPFNPNDGIDQLTNVINLIKTDPSSRRILMTSYNPKQSDQGVLYPCHGLTIQFYVNNGELSTHMYQRSADWFLGVPFNIASYALLTMLIAQVTKLKVSELIISFGDAHIYSDHVQPSVYQLTRDPLSFPTVKINTFIDNIDDFELGDIKLENYQYYPSIPAEMKA